MHTIRWLTALAAGLWSLAASAQTQQTQQQITVQPAEGVAETTVVPVEQPPLHITEQTVQYEGAPQSMSRAERRAYRARLFAERIDSLVESRNYLFYPNSMQGLPGGMIRNIYADYCFFGLFVDHVEVHLPTERNYTQHLGELNFDSMNIRNYQATHLQWGWNITMNVFDGETRYTVEITVSTTTGEAILTLLTPSLTMRYVGALWNGRWAGQPPRHRHTALAPDADANGAATHP